MLSLCHSFLLTSVHLILASKAFVTNNAAAALIFPIAIEAAEGAGINVKIMSYAVMLGASDYTTPFGYQTNLMVYGPGGYKVSPFLT